VEVVACSDISLERATKFASEKEIPRVYANYADMLDAEKLDAISVCTPNYAHCEPTIDALNRGIHVLCEKPIAMNSEEAQKMVDAARETKRMLTVGHHMRFLPVCQFLKRMIDQGELGHIYYGRSHALRRRGVPGWGQFHIKSRSGGGPLVDLGVHTLDLITWLMGSPKPRSVTGTVYTQFGNRQTFYNPHGTYRREDYDVEDFACGLVKFTNGCTLTLEASWAAHLKDEEVYPQTILGDKGGAELMPFTVAKAPTSVRIFKSRDEALVNIEPTAFAVVDAHAEEIKHWVNCLQGEAEVLVRPEESLNVQRILDSIYLSSQEEREIRIDEVHELSGEGSGKVGSNLEVPTPA
jgi:predicted dehydrogenase